MLPVHLYALPCEVLKGLKVNAVTASLSLRVTVTMVMSPPVTIGSPSRASQVAVGASLNPETISETMQVRINIDPAKLLLELLTVAESTCSDGTTV